MSKSGKPCLKQGKLQLRQPNQPNVVVSVDLFGPITYKGGKIYVLTMVDVFSKWVEVAFCRNKQMETIAKAFLDSWVLNHSVPVSVISDRGTEFLNNFFKSLNAMLGIHNLFTTAYHPRGNPAERIHQLFKSAIKRTFNDGGDWIQGLKYIRSAYNNSVIDGYGYSPFFLEKGYYPQIGRAHV